MAKLKINDRVEILGGMAEFVGQLGTIVDDSERDGRTVMFRVELDSPVEIPSLGPVEDDLWAGEFLRRLNAGQMPACTLPGGHAGDCNGTTVEF